MNSLDGGATNQVKFSHNRQQRALLIKNDTIWFLYNMKILDKDLAHWLGVTSSHFSNVMNGTRPITREMAESFETRTGIPLEEWLSGDLLGLREKIQRGFYSYRAGFSFYTKMKKQIETLNKKVKPEKERPKRDY